MAASAVPASNTRTTVPKSPGSSAGGGGGGTGVVVIPSTASIAVGVTVQLTAIPSNGVSWTTSNAAIATVSATGLVTGIAAGTVNITVRKGNRLAVCVVTVTAVVVGSGTLQFPASPDHASVTSYRLNVYTLLDNALAGQSNLGKPTPDANNIITVDVSVFLGTLPLGTYHATVTAISAGGEADSGYSNDFSLPL